MVLLFCAEDSSDLIPNLDAETKGCCMDDMDVGTLGVGTTGGDRDQGSYRDALVYIILCMGMNSIIVIRDIRLPSIQETILLIWNPNQRCRGRFRTCVGCQGQPRGYRIPLWRQEVLLHLVFLRKLPFQKQGPVRKGGSR